MTGGRKALPYILMGPVEASVGAGFIPARLGPTEGHEALPYTFASWTISPTTQPKFVSSLTTGR